MVFDDHDYLDGPNGDQTGSHNPYCWCMTDRDRREDDELDLEPADPILKYSPSGRAVHKEKQHPLANKEFAECGQWAPLGTACQKEFDTARSIKQKCRTCFGPKDPV